MDEDEDRDEDEDEDGDEDEDEDEDEDDGADSNRQQQFLTNGVRYINNLDFVLKNIQILILVTI